MNLWSDRRGITRAAGIVLALIVVMLVLIAIPGWKVFRYRSEKTGCDQGMKTATDGLIIDYLFENKAAEEEDAMVLLDDFMPGRTNICPAGGNVYLVKSVNDIYKTVCGRHDSDRKERARLNATYAKRLLVDQLRYDRRVSETEPETVTIPMNGDPLVCTRVQTKSTLHRGTKTTKDFEGIVCFYGIAGDGIFPVGDLEEGEICYFLYADEDYCAIWNADDGWTGTAYDD